MLAEGGIFTSPAPAPYASAPPCLVSQRNRHEPASVKTSLKGQGAICEDGRAGRRHFVIAYFRGVVRLGPVGQLRRLRPRCSHFSLDKSRSTW